MIQAVPLCSNLNSTQASSVCLAQDPQHQSNLRYHLRLLITMNKLHLKHQGPGLKAIPGAQEAREYGLLGHTIWAMWSRLQPSADQWEGQKRSSMFNTRIRKNKTTLIWNHLTSSHLLRQQLLLCLSRIPKVIINSYKFSLCLLTLMFLFPAPLSNYNYRWASSSS